MPSLRTRVAAVVATASTLGLGLLPTVMPGARAYPSDNVSLEGHGWGHGRGMGQYGALGYALAGWKYDAILDHYYGGTHMGTVDAGAVFHVRLSRFDNQFLIVVQPQGQGAINGGANNNTAMMAQLVSPGSNQFRIYNGPGCGGPWTQVGTVTGQVRFSALNSGSNTNSMLQTCESGGNKPYRSDLYAVDSGGQRAVNALPIDQYLRGVVPAESPSSWGSLTSGANSGMEALKAQSVAARSYAAARGFSNPAGDICDTDACQVYRGAVAEAANTDNAIGATAGQVRMFNSNNAVASTEFSSSTGGVTAGGTFPSVVDDGDAVCVSGACNPNHLWRVQIPVAQVEAAYPAIGSLQGLAITERTPGDGGVRAKTVVLRGSAGTAAVTGESFRTTFGLKSTWFSLLNQPSGGVNGNWLLGNDGGIFSFGAAQFKGSTGGMALNKPVVAMARTKSGNGYWLVASDGGIFAYGDAGFFGSMGGTPLNQPIVGMARTPSGNGYWLVARDGGIFAFGDAQFYGSMGGQRLNQPVVGMAGMNSGKGYWMVASDGGIFAFGHAGFHGSTGSIKLSRPVIAMAARADDAGYWMVAADGGIFAFDAPFYDSLPGRKVAATAAGMKPTVSGGGYLIATTDGRVFSFGDAPNFGGMPDVVPGYRGTIIGLEASPGS